MDRSGIFYWYAQKTQTAPFAVGIPGGATIAERPLAPQDVATVLRGQAAPWSGARIDCVQQKLLQIYDP